MSGNSSFKAALARQASERATSLASSDLPTVSVLLRHTNISQPVDVARALKRLGLSRRKAHLVLDRLAEGEKMPAELDARAVDQDGLEPLRSLGVGASRIASPPSVDVRAIRKNLGLSQADFAARFGLELDTIRDWEQGRYAPDRAAVVLLAVIEHHPEAVDASLADGAV
jgi:DNA-binding transcriptional regulator YiaG